MSKFIRFFDDITVDDVPLVGGKNASLGLLRDHFWSSVALSRSRWN